MSVASAEVMSTIETPVVVGFDFGHSGRAALQRALAVAKRAPFHVLHVACVAEPHAPLAALPAHKVDYQYAERVQEAVARAIEDELRADPTNQPIHFFVHARIGDPADEILSLAREVGADLIIVGSKGARGFERFLLGSVSEKVVREAGCTVEVARPNTYEHVDLLEMHEVKPSRDYVPPHRYRYEDNRLVLRPAEWPIP